MGQTYIAASEWAEWADEILTGYEFAIDLEAADFLAGEMPPHLARGALRDMMLMFVRERAAVRG